MRTTFSGQVNIEGTRDQGRSQDFMQEGATLTGAQGKSLKFKKVIGFHPLFLERAQINGN